MADTRLTPEINLEGLSVEEAFAVLGDETRLDIVRILWRAGALRQYDDIDDSTTAMSFSDLRRQADIDDNGRFNYHLSKLTPHFIRQTEEGYHLSTAGKKIARTVVAISGPSEADLSDETVTNCPVCGGAVTATYDDQWLRFACRECDGLFGDAAPEGTIMNAPFPPAGITSQTPEETLQTSLYRCMLDLTYMIQGICRECASSVDRSVSACESHDSDGEQPCPTCGTPFGAWGEMRCNTCRFAKRLPIELCVVGLPPVITFLHRQDVDVLSPSLDEIVSVLSTQIEVSTAKDRVTATITAGDDELTLFLDERLQVAEVRR